MVSEVLDYCHTLLKMKLLGSTVATIDVRRLEVWPVLQEVADLTSASGTYFRRTQCSGYLSVTMANSQEYFVYKRLINLTIIPMDPCTTGCKKRRKRKRKKSLSASGVRFGSAQTQKPLPLFW